MVIGSDVPLEEDILKKPIEFVKSWVEWSAINEQQVFISGDNTLGMQLLFTVPQNKTFYLTGASIVVSVNSAVNNSTIGLTSSKGFILRGQTQTTATNDQTHYSASQSFIMPLKFETGETISITNSSGLISANIQGFLKAKRIN